jgi:hypothetical protein
VRQLYLYAKVSLIVLARGTGWIFSSGRHDHDFDLIRPLTPASLETLATVKMLIPKADRKAIHELVTLTAVNATPRSSSQLSHEITT